MIAELDLRAADVSDAPEIVAIVRAGFAPTLLDKFIYGCAGIERFVSTQIAERARGTDTMFTVARRDEIVATCEMRVLRDRLFLNYIAVHADARAGGVGSRLLGAAIERAAGPAHEHISLDVLEDNSVANAWYRALGFREEGATDWWTLPLGPSGDRVGLVSGLPQAVVCHDAYGFAQVSITTSSAAFDVGMLGTRWFRTTQPAALLDPIFHATLKLLDPRRDILALLPSGRLPENAAATRVAGTRRLTMSLAELREKLQRKHR